MFKEILTYVHLNSDKISKFHPTMTKGKYELSFVIKGSNHKMLIQTINETTWVKTVYNDLFTTNIDEVINFLESEFEHFQNIQLRGMEDFSHSTGITTTFFYT